MNRVHRRTTHGWATCVLLGLVLSACADDPSSPEEETGLIDGIQTNTTTIPEFFESFERAWRESPQALDALLTRDFQYCVLDVDSEDLPWVTGGCVDRLSVEVVVGSWYSQPILEQVLASGRVEFGFSILNVEPTPEGTSVVADAEVSVLVGDDGWFTDTRYLMDLIVDGGGFLRLRLMQEIRRL